MCFVFCIFWEIVVVRVFVVGKSLVLMIGEFDFIWVNGVIDVIVNLCGDSGNEVV